MENVVLRRWGETGMFGLSTGLITKGNLTFRALALRQRTLRSNEGLTLKKASTQISVRWSNYL